MLNFHYVDTHGVPFNVSMDSYGFVQAHIAPGHKEAGAGFGCARNAVGGELRHCITAFEAYDAYEKVMRRRLSFVKLAAMLNDQNVPCDLSNHIARAVVCERNGQPQTPTIGAKSC